MLNNIIRKFIILFLEIYSALISPFYPPCCRFIPTCTQYAKTAFATHSLHFAVFLVIKRILKCNPWASYGYDPVPKKKIQ
jgi:hypothetical protein